MNNDPMAMCVSDRYLLDLGTNLSFIFLTLLENAPLGNFLGQKNCDREREKSANISRTTTESRKIRDD